MKSLAIIAITIGCILGMIEAISTLDFKTALILGAVPAGIYFVLTKSKRKLFKR